MSELVYGWCGLCQTHTTFPHDCPAEAEALEELERTGGERFETADEAIAWLQEPQVDQKLTDDEERSGNVREDEAA
jgi:hypothetical protein